MLPQDIALTGWQSLWAHRLRTGLSILGIIIGIASFSVMYSIGETARQQTMEALKDLGGDIFLVTVKSKEGSGKGSMWNSFNHEDISRIYKSCPSVLNISPEFSISADIFKGGKFESLTVLGITTTFLTMNKLELERGRLFVNIDEENQMQTCILGNKLAGRLFTDEDSLGKKIAIKGYSFQVVGILKTIERASLEDLNDEALIPLNFAQRLFPDKKIQTLHVQAKNTNAAMAELKQFLQHRFRDKASFKIQSQRMILLARQKSMKIFEYVLWAIGSISLLVGGIGIMNIMLVSVTERVREIGIRRALGATKTEIKLQFLFESTLLCLLGGLGGAILGFLGSRLISQSFQFSPIFSIKLLLIAISISTVLGLICGTYPAARAANQDPTIVLRYE